MRTIRDLVIVGGLCSAVVATTAGAVPKRHQLSCKEVHTAVWAGHTIEQLTAEFNTDAAHIMKCVQARKGKKPIADKKKSASKPETAHRKKGN